MNLKTVNQITLIIVTTTFVKLDLSAQSKLQSSLEFEVMATHLMEIDAKLAGCIGCANTEYGSLNPRIGLGISSGWVGTLYAGKHVDLFFGGAIMYRGGIFDYSTFSSYENYFDTFPSYYHYDEKGTNYYNQFIAAPLLGWSFYLFNQRKFNLKFAARPEFVILDFSVRSMTIHGYDVNLSDPQAPVIYNENYSGGSSSNTDNKRSNLSLIAGIGWKLSKRIEMNANFYQSLVPYQLYYPSYLSDGIELKLLYTFKHNSAKATDK
jgi:hypothetical protein